MDLDQDPLRGVETDTLLRAGKVASAAFGFLWKGSLAVLATAVVMGGFGGSSGPSASLEGASRPQRISIDEEDNGFVYLRLRRADTDRPTHVVFKNSAGRAVASLTYNHLTQSFYFGHVEIGSVRATTWVRHDRSVATSVVTPQVQTQVDAGLDESIGVRAWEASPDSAEGHELGRFWIPPKPAEGRTTKEIGVLK